MRQPHRFVVIIIPALVFTLAPFAASADGTIEGTVYFGGDPGGGAQIELAAYSNPFSSPVATVLVNIPTSAYSIPVADGTYYIAAHMARDGIFGEPRSEDVLAWYDADAELSREPEPSRKHPRNPIDFLPEKPIFGINNLYCGVYS